MITGGSPLQPSSPFSRWFSPLPLTAPPKRGGTLEFAVTVEPGNFDCHANISFAFLHPIAPHYSTLLKFDAANYPQIVGDLAESWSVSPDRLTYTFKLRPNVFFHDGSRLTSADVKASYERIARPPQGVFSARRVDYAAISSIDTPDPLTVVFHLQWPEAAMLANFASPWNCIYSAAKLAQDPEFPKTHVLGTGAFAFVDYVKGQYWRGQALGPVFPARQALSRRVSGGFHAGKRGDGGLQEWPHRRRVPRRHTAAARRSRRDAR